MLPQGFLQAHFLRTLKLEMSPVCAPVLSPARGTYFWSRLCHRLLLISLAVTVPWPEGPLGFRLWRTFGEAVPLGSCPSAPSAQGCRGHFLWPSPSYLIFAALSAVRWVSQACSCPGTWAHVLPAGTFSPSPFPALPHLGMAARHCSSSAATSSGRGCLTALPKAPALPRAPHPHLHCTTQKATE